MDQNNTHPPFNESPKKMHRNFFFVVVGDFRFSSSFLWCARPQSSRFVIGISLRLFATHIWKFSATHLFASVTTEARSARCHGKSRLQHVAASFSAVAAVFVVSNTNVWTDRKNSLMRNLAHLVIFSVSHTNKTKTWQSTSEKYLQLCRYFFLSYYCEKVINMQLQLHRKNSSRY